MSFLYTCFPCITCHCLNLSPLLSYPPLHPVISISQIPFTLLWQIILHSSPVTVPPLAPSHRGNQGSILSLKLLSSYLTLSGNSLCHLCSFKLKFYDSYLWLEILWLIFMSPISLTQTSSLRHLYFSVPTGQHALDSNWHLAINMTNSQHMIYPVPSLRQRI